jgi:capsule polysaccharide export protein KpsE/RkpR
VSGFDAAEAVPALDWDFTKYCGKTASGTITEPSQDQVRAFQASILEVAPGGNVAAAFRSLDAEEAAAANEKLFIAIVKVCSGKPTRAQLDKLPHRVLQAFCGWIFGSITNPR